MSSSSLKTKVEKRSKVAVWFNNLFRTKLEIKTDKLEEMMSASNENQVRGDTTFFYSRGSLQTEVLAKLKEKPTHIELKDLSVSYWCDVPLKLWKEFEASSGFMTVLYQKVNDLTDRLVGEWAKRLTHWERIAAEAAAKNDEAGVNNAIIEFGKDCDALSKECEEVAIETISNFFKDKAQTFGDYKRYKFKAGCKLIATFVGVALSIAALSTAATPAAPATLVPAIIGLVSAALSIGTQLANLASSAEMIEAEIYHNLEGIEVNYKDSKGKPRKKTYKAREFGAGFLSGLTGGFSDVFIPSIKALLDETGLHKSKLDGLDVSLHAMGIALNGMVDGLGAAQQVLENNRDFLQEKLKTNASSAKIAKAIKAIDAAHKKFVELANEFYSAFEAVPEMIQRIERGRESNQRLSEDLQAIQKALGTGGFATAANILASLSLVAIGFSSGLPSTQIEKIMTATTGAWSGVDLIREYTPDVMEKIGIG